MPEYLRYYICADLAAHQAATMMYPQNRLESWRQVPAYVYKTTKLKMVCRDVKIYPSLEYSLDLDSLETTCLELTASQPAPPTAAVWLHQNRLQAGLYKL